MQYLGLRFLTFIIGILFLLGCHVKSEIPDRPNIVFIFADDLGYGDLGCFGATDIKTPHIDRIANQGVKFTNLYSASSVCSPSRAGLLTGRYPQRWGLHGVFFANSLGGMSGKEVTLAEVLSPVGYTCGIVGKWHLGHTYEYLPLQQGFDSYFGIPYSNDMESVIYMRDNKIVEWEIDQSQMIKRYTNEAISFIDNRKSEHFFLYVAHNMPHVPIYASQDFLGTSDRGLYGDVIQEIDWSVGQILEKLEHEQLLDNTIVVFSSDNGPWLVMKELGGSAGELREGKQFTFDGGMKVPTVAMWKNKIPAGQIHEGVISQMDWFPTFSSLAGAELDESIDIDGINITSTLLENMDRDRDEVLLFGIGGKLRGIRDGKYKMKLPFEGFEGAPWRLEVAAHDTLIFDIQADPGELVNLYPDRQDLVGKLSMSLAEELNRLGPLPKENYLHRTPPDNSHYHYLKALYGEGVTYWKNSK